MTEPEAPAEVTIRIRENGPLVITGPVNLVDHERKPLAGAGANAAGEHVPRENIALCRCGLSATKPFCDGTHRDGFDGALAEVPPA